MPKQRVNVMIAGQTGLIYDVKPINLPLEAWSRGINYKIKNGSVTSVNGRVSTTIAPPIQPQHLLPLENDTADYWLYAGYDSVAGRSGICTLNANGNHSDISPTVPLTSGLPAKWSTDVYSTFAVITNNDDVPHTWDGVAANAVPLVNWPATYTCSTIKSYKQFLITSDITKGANNFSRMIKWSDQADPGTLPTSWDETDPTVLAGENELKSKGGAIVDMQVLNDTLYIYRETAVDSMSFIGGNLVFSFKQLFNGWGVMAQNCVATLGRKHWVFANNDFLVHDGSTYQSIIEGKQRNKIFNEIDGVFQDKCYVTTNNNENEVWFCYPETGETACTKAFTYNIVTGETGERRIPNLAHAAAGRRLASTGGTWDSDTRTWDEADQRWNANETVGLLFQLSCSANDSKIYTEDVGSTDDGADIESWIERQDILLPGLDPMMSITITDVFPLMETQNVIATTESYILVGSKFTTQGGLIWNQQYDFDPINDYKITSRVTGKLPAFRFYWKGKGQLVVNGFSFNYVTRGRR